MIGQSNQGEQTESRDSSSDIRFQILLQTMQATQLRFFCPQVDVQTLEENIVHKVRSELDNEMKSVETRVQDAVLTAIDIAVIPTVKLAMKSTNAHSEWSVDGNVLEPDQREFLGNIGGLRMPGSSRINSHTDINRIDETRGNINVEEGDLLVNEKNIDRQTHGHYTSKRVFFQT